jgi:hypothetical protein
VKIIINQKKKVNFLEHFVEFLLLLLMYIYSLRRASSAGTVGTAGSVLPSAAAAAGAGDRRRSAGLSTDPRRRACGIARCCGAACAQGEPVMLNSVSKLGIPRARSSMPVLCVGGEEGVGED